MIEKTLNNRYRINSLLGEGGMGEVYLATDKSTGQQVAVKVLARSLSTNPDSLERFRREAETLRQLDHPNIVKFVDAFDHEGQYVIVMEYVSGGSLHDLLKNGPLPIERAHRIALELCDALIRSHHLNIVHRDLKPDNVLLDKDGKPKLADFGVARLEEGTRMTRTGTQVGTPYYMAPEAWEGKPLDAQADIWSLGIMLFEMLAGQVPFGGDTPLAVMSQVNTAALPNLKKMRADAPAGLIKVIKRMLTRDKKRRYPTMREVAVDLERRQPKKASEFASRKPILKGKNYKLEGLYKYMIGIGILALLVLGTGKIFYDNGGVEFAEPSSDATSFPAPATLAIELSDHANTATPTIDIGASLVSEKDGMILLFVPEGEFLMGSNPVEASPAGNEFQSPSYFDNTPQFSIALDAFWIDQTEVTNKQFAQCVSDGKCKAPLETTSPARSDYFGNPEFENYPVIHVEWEMAKDYCEWAGRRLPTEAEWEKAARGTDARLYPWGNDPPNDILLNYNHNTRDTTEVGKYPDGKSVYGAYDMAGNVWEWVSSLYLPYPYDSEDGREDLNAASERVLRGGSWYFEEGSLRSIFRFGVIPAADLVRSDIRSFSEPVLESIGQFGRPPHGFGTIGFRCASDLEITNPMPAVADEDGWNGTVSARKPTLNEIRDELVSIWDANDLFVEDMPTPGIKSYSGSANADQEYLWPIYWCALDRATLDENLLNISTLFLIDGETVPDEYIFEYYLDTENGWKCHYRASVIGDLPINTTINLQVIRTFSTEIFDGVLSYPAGNYTYELVISVK